MEKNAIIAEISINKGNSKPAYWKYKTGDKLDILSERGNKEYYITDIRKSGKGKNGYIKISLLRNAYICRDTEEEIRIPAGEKMSFGETGILLSDISEENNICSAGVLLTGSEEIFHLKKGDILWSGL